MSDDDGPTDRAEMEHLVQRARAGLRDWTDHTDSDPGVALLELFAYVGDLLGSYAERLADEGYLSSSRGRRRRRTGAYSSVHLQDGRVVVDADWREEPSAHLGGVYPALVVDNADPLVQRRLLVRVAEVGGAEAVWAVACLPVPGTPGVPAVGDGVWVAFESGDRSRPVWLGRRGTA